jgi:hypothetical protein
MTQVDGLFMTALGIGQARPGRSVEAGRAPDLSRSSQRVMVR